MHVPRRLSTVVLFAVAGLLALVFSGLLDWVASLLFLSMEFLAERFRPWLDRSGGRPQRQRRPRRDRPRRLVVHHRRGSRGRGARDGRVRGRRADVDAAEAPAPVRLRILVPLSDERPGLVAFAVEECRSRRGAELLVLFLRPLAVVPMGPNALPTLAEDAPARAVLEHVKALAEEAGVPIRTLYAVSRDMPATILDAAREHAVDVLVMEATRRGFLWRALMGDQVRSVLVHLPERVSLLIRS